MGNDIEIRVRVANQTQAGVASVRQSIANGLRGAPATVPVTVDNQTAAGVTRVQGQLRQLRAQSPIRLTVRFDGQSGQVTATSRAVRSLDTAAQNASDSLTALTARAVAASVALQRLAAAAEDAKQELNGLRTAAARAATAIGRLGDRAEAAEGRLSSLRGTVSDLSRDMGHLGDSSRYAGGGLRDLRGGLGRVTISAGSASNALGGGGGGMGLRGQLIATAAAVGTTLLPTIGALAPMLTGLTVVAGGGALALDDLKKKAKELKQPFEEWRKVAEKAVAPHTEKAVKSLKSAMEDLNPVIKIGADTFGRITEKAAAFVDSPAFQASFAKNAEMGSKWVEEFGSSIGTFTQAFLDFGTKSQPALDAWQGLLGGMLDRGLPSMFKEMERGVGGSSEFLNGLAYVINDSVLPALGKVAGSFMKTFGPLTKELMIGAGNAIKLFGELFVGAMKTLEPVAKVATDVFRGLNEIFKIGASVAGSLARALGGALLGTMGEFLGQSGKVDGMRGSFSRFSDWVKENQATIRMAFTAMGIAMINMIDMGIQSIPMLIGAFRGMTDMVLTSVDMMISGLAGTFGDVPVIGDKLKEWNSSFDEMAGGFREKLGGMQESAQEFADIAGKHLGRAKVELNIDQARTNLAYIKEQLKDPNLTKERRAKLSADKRQAEANLADAHRKLKAFDRSKGEAKLKANPNSFWSTVRSIPQVVGSRQINVHYSYKGGKRSDGATFMGPSGRYAEGGVVEGPGTDTSDSVPIMASRDEFIVNAKSSRKHRGLLEAINNGDLRGYAKGGTVTKSEREARSGARGDLTISHFGRMAGYRTSEIIGQLGRPDSLGSLVNALNSWRSTIMKSTHGGQERSLLRALDSSGRKLLSWEKQLTKVSASLEKAKDKLDSLKSAASQLADGVKSGILGSANITRGAGEGLVTTRSVMGGLIASRDKATAFSGALADLKKKGLSSALLQQIAEAGIEGGGLETAGALMGASSSEIQSMNSLQSQIGSAAGAAGKTTSDAVFGAQIKAQQAYVSTLTKSQDRLEKSMERLAKSMEKLIEKAFKGKAAGGVVGAAASGGIRSNLTWVGEHGPELVNLAPGTRVWSNPDSRRMQQQAWASMLNEPRGGRHAQGRPAVAAGGSSQPLVIQVRIAEREFGELWVDVGRNEVRSRGSIEATLKPYRGR